MDFSLFLYVTQSLAVANTNTALDDGDSPHYIRVSCGICSDGNTGEEIFIFYSILSSLGEKEKVYD